MSDLHELITRARFLFSRAPNILETFKLINGKRTSREIVRITGRWPTNILRDIEKLRDFDLILRKKDGYSPYEKTPLMKHVSLSFFNDIFDSKKLAKKKHLEKAKQRKAIGISIPSGKQILDICKYGEDQLYEFKEPGVAMHKLTKKIAGYLHTKNGGIIFYGIDDDGIIIGSDIKRQDFDQKLHNSIRNTLNPQPNITIKGRDVMGYYIILVIIPPWDKKTFYEYTKEQRYFIKKGTNVFSLKPEELNLLQQGKYVV